MNLYETLGVRDGANPTEILWAYKGLSEANQDGDFETQLAIGEAFQTLINPELRSQYDQTLNKSYLVQASVPSAVQESFSYNHTENNYQVYQSTSRPNSLATVTIWFTGAFVTLTMILLIIIAI